MAATQLIEDAMTESFLHFVLGDIHVEYYSSNPCEWDWETTSRISDQAKLDRVLLQQSTMMTLLQNLQEGQKHITLRIEQLETIAHFATPLVHVRSSRPPIPQPVTPSVNRQPPVTHPSIDNRQWLHLSIDNRCNL